VGCGVPYGVSLLICRRRECEFNYHRCDIPLIVLSVLPSSLPTQSLEMDNQMHILFIS
jgi:hypothetical protein